LLIVETIEEVGQQLAVRCRSHSVVHSAIIGTHHISSMGRTRTHLADQRALTAAWADAPVRRSGSWISVEIGSASDHLRLSPEPDDLQGCAHAFSQNG
jgi:hypothetical protein